MLAARSFRWAVLLAGIGSITGNSHLSAQPSLPISPQTPSTIQIRQALGRPTTLHVGQLTIRELSEELRRQHAINVVIDRRGLDEAGITEQASIGPIQLTSVSLASLLNVTLNEVDLAWQVRDEGLVITTPEEAEKTLETRVYPVSDLVVTPHRPSRQELQQIRKMHGYDPFLLLDPFGEYTDYDSLIEMITSTISPVTWDEVGGDGSIAPFPIAHVLVISQTRSVHDKIGPLLAALRTAKKRQGVASAARLHSRASSRSGPRERRNQSQAAAATASHYVYRNNATWRTPKIRESGRIN